MPEFASVVPTRSVARTVIADLPASGFDYGPTFQGIERLWRGDREMLAEIHAPSGVQRARSRLSIASRSPGRLLPDLDARSCLDQRPQSVKGEIFVPVKIERIRFHAAPPTRAVRLHAS